MRLSSFAGRRGWRPLILPLVALVVALAAGGAYAAVKADGSAPPEYAANAATGYPTHNFDLAGTRANLTSDISSSTVSTLKQKWTFQLPYVGNFGAFTANPVVQNGVVYIQDPKSNVYALNQQTGAVIWSRIYNKPTPSGGPNGVAVGYGMVYGATDKAIFALDVQTGKQVWAKRLTENKLEGIDMAPQLYGGKVLVSTIPGNGLNFYKGGAYGTVYSLDAKTGQLLWSFATVLHHSSNRNGGGGLWYPPAVDSQGRVFLDVANPGLWPNTPDNPNAKSRPGWNLFTDTIVAVDGDTGHVLWHNQVVRHDVRDYDLQVSSIVGSIVIDGVPTEVVYAAGKMGKVLAFRADNGHRVWNVNVGRHSNDIGLLPNKLVLVCPGPLGGVETPMALAGGSLYVPVVNLCAKESATGLGELNFGGGTGQFYSLNASTGAVNWVRSFPQIDVGAATVANDVVFTSSYDGTIYALSVKDGSTLWSAKAPVGINSFPAVTKDMVIVGAGAVTKAGQHGEIIAYSLNGQ